MSPLPDGYALASARVAREGRKIRFMYREASDRADDSGWRFFSGDEPQAYVDDSSNIGLYAVGTIAAIDPSIVPLLATLAPCAFERDDENGPFRSSTDFDFSPEGDVDSQ
ncbi:MAG: hypothetical protein NVS4B3_03530 [Gemmatimonadaceae bacterium]